MTSSSTEFYGGCGKCESQNRMAYSLDSRGNSMCREIVCEGGILDPETDTCLCPPNHNLTLKKNVKLSSPVIYQCKDLTCTNGWFGKAAYGNEVNQCYDVQCIGLATEDSSGGPAKMTCSCPDGYYSVISWDLAFSKKRFVVTIAPVHNSIFIQNVMMSNVRMA